MTCHGPQFAPASVDIPTMGLREIFWDIHSGQEGVLAVRGRSQALGLPWLYHRFSVRLIYWGIVKISQVAGFDIYLLENSGQQQTFSPISLIIFFGYLLGIRTGTFRAAIIDVPNECVTA